MLDKNFNPKTAEKRIYEAWEKSGAFHPRPARNNDNNDDNFSIVIPPPNVTGSLHMGHALNNTIQDILARYNRMLGKAVLWQPGTDHAGIATQMVVERQLATSGGKTRKDMSREEFIAKVWEWKNESGGNINNQLKRLGSSCDWSREKFTLGNPDDPNDKMAEAVTKAFVDLYNDGLVYRDKRLVNWDPHFQTAISDLEVENIEVDGHFWHFKYMLADGETYTYVEKDEDGNVVLEETRDYISIATTRPETMLGDGAVAVHPDDERYKPIIGKMVHLPLADRLIPIITDEYPDPDFGSGAVKITGAHDFNDYEVAKRNNIPLYPLMDEQARMIKSEIMPDKYVGMDRFEARKAVVADIDAQGLLIKVEDKKVMQPFGDRSKVVIEPMLTDQWFVHADKLAKQAIEAVDNGKTKFIPANWKKTYDIWMKDIQPWCISRQLWWGHQIPAWYGISLESIDTYEEEQGYTRKVFVAKTEAEACKLAKKYYGENVHISIAEDGVTCHAIRDNGELSYIELVRDPDVLDTWFSSGLWPFSTLGWPEETDELNRFYPTSVLVTAFDIIFFWVARMMMMGLYFKSDIPFGDVYIHALVLDEQGKKMSKSEGNVIDPIDLIDGIGIDELVKKRTTGLRQPEKAPKVEKATRKQYPQGFEAYGADALRFTLAAMAGQGRNIRLSVERVAGYRNFGTKLWNAARFLQMNECVFNSGFEPESCKNGINQWLVSEAITCAAKVSEMIEAYRFNDAADAIYKFAWGQYCDWYLELIKPLLSAGDDNTKNETRMASAWGFEQILKTLHPFMPFITEELWQKTAKREQYLIITKWPDNINTDFDNAKDDINWLIGLVSEIRSARAEMNIPPGKKSEMFVIGANTQTKERLKQYINSIKPLARLENFALADEIPKNALQAVYEEATFALPLAGLIDQKAERDRLDREISKLKAEIEKIDKKLANKNFVERAPKAVVKEQYQRRDKFIMEMQKLNQALDNLPS